VKTELKTVISDLEAGNFAGAGEQFLADLKSVCEGGVAGRRASGKGLMFVAMLV
jgi:hypothetical protein